MTCEDCALHLHTDACYDAELARYLCDRGETVELCPKHALAEKMAALLKRIQMCATLPSNESNEICGECLSKIELLLTQWDKEKP